MTKHTFMTANYGNYERAKLTAETFGMDFHGEHRPTCCKKYMFTVTAETFEQDVALNALILACTAHQEQAECIKHLMEFVAKKRERGTIE